MLAIRFSRIGKRKRPTYRIILSEKHKDTQGMFHELLGSYDPHTKAAQLKADRIVHWMKVGAEVSNSVYNLLIKHKIVQSDKKRSVVHISKKRKAKIEQAKQAAAPAAAPTEAAA